MLMCFALLTYRSVALFTSHMNAPRSLLRIDDNSLPDIDFDDISCDQAAIRSGTISDDLLREKPGPPSQARWLTTASRVCRLYVSTESPSPELSLLTKFVVCHYGPLWFRMKFHPRCTDGSRHFLQQAKLHRSE